jgi:hypothetical protein
MQTIPAQLASEVWVVIIEHREGQDVTAHQTMQGARDYLAAYCAEWWKDVNDAPPPSDPGELIFAYFEACSEKRSITCCWVREGR